MAVLVSSCTRGVSLTSRQSVEQGVFSVSDADLATAEPSDRAAEQAEPKQVQKSDMMRVGILLPLSGKAAKTGEALRNAAMMSLFDVAGNRLVLQFYDTEGTTEGARKASELAIAQGVELIIGPVFSQHVRAIRENTHSADVGVITFSSHPSNLGDGVYTISTLTSQQVDHIVSYACDKGYKRFAVLSQDNAMGDIVAMAAKAAADRCGATITKAGFYHPETNNLQPVVQSIMPRTIEDLEKDREEELERLEKMRENAEAGLPVKIKNDETGEEEEVLMTVEALTERMETLKNTEIVRDPFEFDALLITEEGSRLRSLGALLSYYDVPSDIRILGTSQWANSSPARESALIGGWFSSLPSSGFKRFSARYKNIYGEKPPRIASQAYDAVALAAVLAETGSFSTRNLTNPSGFRGVDGLFRLLQNGLSERGLEVLGVEKKGYVTLSPAPEVFETEPEFIPNVFDKGYRYSSEFIPPPQEEVKEEDGVIVVGGESAVVGDGNTVLQGNGTPENPSAEGREFKQPFVTPSSAPAEETPQPSARRQEFRQPFVTPSSAPVEETPQPSVRRQEFKQPFVTPVSSYGNEVKQPFVTPPTL